MMGEYDAGYENCIDAMVRQMEDMQFRIDSLHRENAKLRELCADMLSEDMDQHWPEFTRRARELEVDA